MQVGGGIAVDKTIGLIEGKDEYILDYGQDDVNMVDKSFSILRLEDMTNGSKSRLTLGLAKLSTGS